MYKVQKWIFPDLDLREGVEHVNTYVSSIVEVSEYHILAYDTENYIVYHTELEVDKAIENVDIKLIKAYEKEYIESKGEIHDCINEMENIVNQVMLLLNDDSNRYFVSLFDYVEEKISSKIIISGVNKKFVITNKTNQVLMALNGKYQFTDNLEFAYTFDTVEDASRYNENVEDLFEDLTYIKILQNGIIINPEEII